jgi:hypothetical protein
MVVTDINETSRTRTIILRPNPSWSWRPNVFFLAILMDVSMTIAFGFLFIGARIILPFSILKMTVVVLCIHYCVKQRKRQEVITISACVPVGIRRSTSRVAIAAVSQRPNVNPLRTRNPSKVIPNRAAGTSMESMPKPGNCGNCRITTPPRVIDSANPTIEMKINYSYRIPE